LRRESDAMAGALMGPVRDGRTSAAIVAANSL
jgi:hypothetical protein